VNPVRVIFESGVTARLFGSQWRLVNLRGGETTPVGNPKVVTEQFALKPVVLTQRLSRGDQIDLLLRCLDAQSFGVAITDVEQDAYRTISPLWKIFDLAYLLRAVEYHCVQLCRHYSAICEVFARIPIPEATEGDVAIFGGRPEPYYEFDALVTSVRRGYDACRYLLWEYFGPGQGSVPSSFKKVLPRCGALPNDLRERLTNSWVTFGEDVTAYRDCIQHYCPVDFGISSVRMHRLSNGVWSVRVPIPDNPSARSRGKFTYGENRDALSYGWRVAEELLGLAASIVTAIPDRTSKGGGDVAQPGAAADANLPPK
jgi:hypothetical protein